MLNGVLLNFLFIKEYCRLHKSIRQHSSFQQITILEWFLKDHVAVTGVMTVALPSQE